MSNESEKERIDLTQFEGMTKQSLALRGVIYVSDGASVECGLDDPRCQTIDIGNVARMNEDRLGYIRPAYAEEQWSKTLATARLFSEAPDLIAELKRCYEKIDAVDQLVCLLDELLDTDNMTFSKREEIGDPSHLWGILTSYFFEG
tara:strand:+ start:2010 stop:2447 length:438 start_codon:yes stop_codon:yes gene_type:complete